jgi:hypothetical protein
MCPANSLKDDEYIRRDEDMISERRVLMATAMLFCTVSAALPSRSAEPEGKPKTSDQAFKNVQVLKDIPLDEFMGTMGVMTGSLGFDCTECHKGAGTEYVDWALNRVVPSVSIPKVGGVIPIGNR